MVKRKVVITGGSKGLGLAIKHRLSCEYDTYDISRTSQNFDNGKEAIVAFSPDVLILNHGVWNAIDIVYINLMKTIAFARQAQLEMLIHKRPSHIIFILSNSAYQGFPGNEEYAATKAGLLGFARCFYQSLKNTNIKVSTISPGTINTGFWDNAQVDNRKNGCMTAESVADLVYAIIKAGEAGAVVTELIVLPEQKGTKK